MDCLKVYRKENVRFIQFNNTKKKNAISSEGYELIGKTLTEDKNDDTIVATIFTGTGEYFTSGNDLTASMEKIKTEDPEVVMRRAWQQFRSMVEAFLSYPKLTIAIVNGPAVGIGVTICGLCDICYASETATFMTPFVKLALTIEGCASYMLPRIMGKSKASELLLLGQRIPVDEALRFNLISKIIPKDKIEEFINGVCLMVKNISVKSLIMNKRLLMLSTDNATKLAAVNECDALWIAQNSEEFFQNLMTFQSRKQSKL